MQFHLNGFRPGDPHISQRDEQGEVTGSVAPFPEHLDVLIVGCGPAGLTLAAQLAAYTGHDRERSQVLVVGACAPLLTTHHESAQASSPYVRLVGLEPFRSQSRQPATLTHPATGESTEVAGGYMIEFIDESGLALSNSSESTVG